MQLIIWLVMVCLTVIFSSTGAAAVNHVRNVDPEDLLTIKAPDGWLFLEGDGRVVFPPGAETLLLVDEPGELTETVVLVDPKNEQEFFTAGEIGIADVINIAFSNRGEYSDLLLFDGSSEELISVRRQGDCCANLGPTVRHDASSLGIRVAGGMSVDPSNGHLFILDVSSSRIVVVDPGPDRSYDVGAAFEDGRVSAVDISSELVGTRGLAYNPANDRFFVISPAAHALFELSRTGGLIAAHDLSGVDLTNLKGVVFAPSLDPTDDPTSLHLFIATGRRVIEFSITAGD